MSLRIEIETFISNVDALIFVVLLTDGIFFFSSLFLPYCG